MEKSLLKSLFITFLGVASLLIYSNTGGPTNTDATGSPFDSNQNACTQCHTTYALNSGTGSVSINAPATYYPGESYSVTISVAQTVPVPAKYGFQALPLRDNNAAGGTITAGSGQGTWTSSGRSYVQHNSTTNTSGNWTFTWNAPSYADTIVIYASGLAANGGNGNNNDYTYTTTSTILPIQPIAFAKDSTSASCFGSCDGSASVTVSGGGVPPYAYAWSTGDTTSFISGVCAGTYTLTITDSESHEEETEIVVEQPTPIQGQFTVLPSSCAFGDGEISVAPVGGAGGYSYLWNDTANTTDSVIMQAGTGWFTVTITDSTGCVGVDSAEVFASNSGLNGITMVTPNYCDLDNGTATIQMFAGNAPYTYSWTSGSSSMTATDLSAGTYTVTVVDNLGCLETFQAIVDDNSLLIQDSLSATDSIRCFNGNDGHISVGVNGGITPYTYVWSHDSNANSASYSNLMAGTYIVTVRDIQGCEDIDTFVVHQPDSVYVEVDIDSANEGFCDGAIDITMFGGSPPYTYSWPHDSSVSHNSSDSLCSGSYLITTTDAKGCLFLVNVEVPIKLGVNEVIGEALRLYPNPSAGVLYFSHESKMPIELDVYDLKGTHVLRVQSERDAPIDVSQLSSGPYQLRIRMGSMVEVRKLIIE